VWVSLRLCQRPYEFNCTFTACHPETGGANWSEPERVADRQFPVVHQDTCVDDVTNKICAYGDLQR
jgi:hypothetical protein